MSESQNELNLPPRSTVPGGPRARAPLERLLEERLRELVRPLVPGLDRPGVRLGAELSPVAQVLSAVDFLEGGDGDRAGRGLFALQAEEQQRDARAVPAAHEGVADVEPEVFVALREILLQDLRQLLVPGVADDARRRLAGAPVPQRTLERNFELR